MVGIALKDINAGIPEDKDDSEKDTGDDDQPSESGIERYIAVPRQEITKQVITIGLEQSATDLPALGLEDDDADVDDDVVATCPTIAPVELLRPRRSLCSKSSKDVSACIEG